MVFNGRRSCRVMTCQDLVFCYLLMIVQSNYVTVIEEHLAKPTITNCVWFSKNINIDIGVHARIIADIMCSFFGNLFVPYICYNRHCSYEFVKPQNTVRKVFKI